tara:strand:+ start:201 stop:461 length:261 start_codon:yes stop_codon:yes gene_type:complete
MKAIGNNLIINMTKIGVSETKGGLFLAEKQREDIRYTEGTVLSAGGNVVGIKKDDVIYYDKNNSHQIEIKKEIYQIVNMAHVVVVL